MNTKFTPIKMIGLFFFICMSSSFAATVTDTYKDEFGTVSYMNNNGTRTFSTGWIESGETTSPSAGNIQIDSGQLRFRNLDNVSISRNLNLSGASSVKLDLKYQRTSGTQSVAVQLWNGLAWNTRYTINSTGPASMPQYTLLPSEISSTSGIRFIAVNTNWGGSDIVYVDDVLFTAVYLDTDSDGVIDNTDVDDDNDGILDSVENLIDLSIFELHGNASQISATEIQITPDAGNQYGSAMSYKTVDLSKSFTIDAEIYVGNNNAGADGMTFVLHNDPRGSSAIGNGEGSTLGAMANGSTPGIANGISMEFDTYQSSGGSADIANDHTQIRDTDITFNNTAGAITGVRKV